MVVAAARLGKRAAEWLCRLTGSASTWSRTVNLNTQAEAVRAGLGIAVPPKFLAARQGFRRVPEDETPLGFDPWFRLLVSTLGFDPWLIRSRENDAPDIVETVSRMVECSVVANRDALVFE